MPRRSPRQRTEKTAAPRKRRTVRAIRDAVGLREEAGESLSDEEHRKRNAAIAKQRRMNETRFYETSKAPVIGNAQLDAVCRTMRNVLERTTGNAEKPWVVSDVLGVATHDARKGERLTLRATALGDPVLLERQPFEHGDTVLHDGAPAMFALEQDGEALISRVVNGKTRWYSAPMHELVRA